MHSDERERARAKIAVRPGSGEPKPVRRTFPGPRDANTPLRVAVERPAYAELIAHAKESLDAEVCGVLAGQICTDDEGLFVHVAAVIRASAAAQGATHVTFTQAAWEAIHATLERDHPKSRIVGWYHTHPGFGVEFSEMDLFIQRNFFPGPTQIALVTDPLSGAVAIAYNTAQGIECLPRFWVDGREQPARVPAVAPAATSAGPASTEAPPALAATVQALEARVSQLVQAADEQRLLFQRFLYAVGFTVCFSLIAIVGYVIYHQFTSRLEPPRLNNYVPIPIQVGDKTMLIGVGVVQWDVPPELDALILRMAETELEQAKQRAGLPLKSSPEPAPAAGTKAESPSGKPHSTP